MNTAERAKAKAAVNRAVKDQQLASVGTSATRSEKCSCKSSGRWVVEDPMGEFFVFDPPTQLQKDIWLGDGERNKTRELRISMLRWLCFGCGTVQAP